MDRGANAIRICDVWSRGVSSAFSPGNQVIRWEFGHRNVHRQEDTDLSKADVYINQPLLVSKGSSLQRGYRCME